VISLPLNYDGHEFPEKYLCHTRESALLSGIKFSRENKSIAEVGQHKASPLLAVASGYGRSACNASLMQAYVCYYSDFVAPDL